MGAQLTKLQYFTVQHFVRLKLMVKKIQYFLVLAAAFALAASFAFPKDKNNGIRTIVIDAGHGGKDPGCGGVKYKEKDVSLAVALKLGKLIEENLKDVKVIYTRTTDVFVELEDRAQIANKAKADLFISIHCNAAGKPVVIKDKKTGKKRIKTYKNKKGKIVPVEKPNPVPFGTETYVMGLKNEEGKMKVATRENSAILLEDNYESKYGGFDPESEESYIIMSNYTSAYVLQSAALAMKLQDEYAKKAGRIDKGVHRQSIWVLWRTSMPSILTEIGYLTNPLEEEFLGSEKGQEYLAKAIFRGLRKYKDETEGNKKTYNDEIENQTALENENIKAGNIPGQKSADDDDEEEDDKDVVKDVKKDEKAPEKKEEAAKTDDKKESVTKEEDTDEKKDKASDGKSPESVAEKTQPEETKSKEEEKNTQGASVVKIPPVLAEKSDSSLSAKDIAEKFRKKDAEPGKEKTAIKKEPEQKPVADNPQKDQVVYKVQFASSDVELNLKLDKFRDIVEGSYYKMNNVLKYTSGNFSSAKDAVSHQNTLREKGYKDCFVVAFRNGERINLNSIAKSTP
jgi:N-acetylmuramoyl-L-alanine amidase